MYKNNEEYNLLNIFFVNMNLTWKLGQNTPQCRLTNLTTQTLTNLIVRLIKAHFISDKNYFIIQATEKKASTNTYETKKLSTIMQ